MVQFLRYHACGYPFRNRCPVSGHLLRNPFGATIGAPFANQQVFGFHCFGATGATIGAPFANQQILGLQALGLLGLPRGTLCQPANPWITSSRATGATSGHPLPTSKSLDYKLYGYWGYLGAPFANQQILGLQALGLLGLPRGTLCQPANPWMTRSRATGATSGHPLPTSKSLDYKL